MIYGHFIGGQPEYVGELFDIFNKYTGERLAQFHRADRSLVARAVDNALTTFRNHKLTPADRSEILAKTSQLIHQKKEDLVRSLVREVGKTIRDARIEVDRAIATFHIAAEESKRIVGRMIPINGQRGQENRLSFTIRVPVGVIGAITPFNFPLNLTAHKIAPAIAAGNTVVLKPAELTPITVMKLIEILQEAGLPGGFVNVVNGFGHETGQYLLEDERINMFTFTGSATVGRHIKSTTGIRKVTLELGSNAPNIIHHDAENLDHIADLCVSRSFNTAGQACISIQRLYIHADIFQTMLNKLVSLTKQLKVGNPEDPDIDIGPMISEKEAKRAEEWIYEAVEQGATIGCGGKRQGSILSPTILMNVRPAMKVMCREVFAPIVCLVPYHDIQDAFKAANGTNFGLQVGLFTSSLSLAMQAAEQLEFGGVIINDASTFRSDVMPYGGIKDSGLGKEGPRYAIEEMTDEKTIVLNL